MIDEDISSISSLHHTIREEREREREKRERERGREREKERERKKRMYVPILTSQWKAQAPGIHIIKLINNTQPTIFSFRNNAILRGLS